MVDFKPSLVYKSRAYPMLPEADIMTAKKVEIRTIGKSDPDGPILVLKQFADGWTYEVQDLESGPLRLPWRVESMQAAEERLRASYDETIWQIRILEDG